MIQDRQCGRAVEDDPIVASDLTESLRHMVRTGTLIEVSEVKFGDRETGVACHNIKIISNWNGCVLEWDILEKDMVH